MGSAKRGKRKGGGISGGKGNKIPATCDYALGMDEDEATMKLKCKSCPGPHAIEGECLSPLLSGFAREYNVRKITVSHYVEKQYYGHSITLLGKITGLAGEMENLALRDPIKEYFGRKAQKERKRIACTRCPLDPGKLFSKMQGLVMMDVVRFYDYLKAAARKIPGFKKRTKQCSRCLEATTEDLHLAFDEYEKLAGFISANAYGIMLRGNRDRFSWMLSPGMMEQYLSPLAGFKPNYPPTKATVKQCPFCQYTLIGNEAICPHCRAAVTI